jgi:hypothetical protein
MRENTSRRANRVLRGGGAIKYKSHAIIGVIIVQMGRGSLNFIHKCKTC